MIFGEDGVLFSLVDSSSSMVELEETVVEYIRGEGEDAEVAGMSSPLDGGLDFAKRKRMKQAARA